MLNILEHHTFIFPTTQLVPDATQKQQRPPYTFSLNVKILLEKHSGIWNSFTQAL
jgi:hypothetical protein